MMDMENIHYGMNGQSEPAAVSTDQCTMEEKMDEV